MDDGLLTGYVLMKFCKTFDTVKHGLLKGCGMIITFLIKGVLSEWNITINRKYNYIIYEPVYIVAFSLSSESW